MTSSDGVVGTRFVDRHKQRNSPQLQRVKEKVIEFLFVTPFFTTSLMHSLLFFKVFSSSFFVIETRDWFFYSPKAYWNSTCIEFFWLLLSFFSSWTEKREVYHRNKRNNGEKQTNDLRLVQWLIIIALEYDSWGIYTFRMLSIASSYGEKGCVEQISLWNWFTGG